MGSNTPFVAPPAPKIKTFCPAFNQPKRAKSLHNPTPSVLSAYKRPSSKRFNVLQAPANKQRSLCSSANLNALSLNGAVIFAP